MVSFPSWVEGPECADNSAHARACRRVRFLVYLAAIHATKSASLASLTDKCDIERSHLHAAIREGKFSPQMATKVERACGRKVMRRDWLMFPLEIEELVH